MIVPSSYPVQGIVYFLGHPQLITSLLCPILLTIIWAIAATIFAFAYLLQLQAHALINVNCPAGVAWFVSVIFVLLEIALMILLFYLIILPIYQDALFDRVLRLRGLKHVLERAQGNDVAKCMRGVHGGLVVVFFQIMVLIITLPVNVIPIFGQILFALLNGWVFTFACRFHYNNDIRNISISQGRSEAWANRKSYTSFGSVAVGLEMVPFANLIFMWTNIVGCALWVADEIEQQERQQHNQPHPPHHQDTAGLLTNAGPSGYPSGPSSQSGSPYQPAGVYPQAFPPESSAGVGSVTSPPPPAYSAHPSFSKK
ncbi:hypothetical protein BGZ73_001090 [Actinomortierella ambigua]|nr:hypothetical protein BGZ73_001090 [Actinomortierella ambigua]